MARYSTIPLLQFTATAKSCRRFCPRMPTGGNEPIRKVDRLFHSVAGGTLSLIGVFAAAHRSST